MGSATNFDIGPLTVIVIWSILEVFFLCASGYVLARVGILNKKIRKQLNHVNVSLFTPSLLFSKVAFFLTPQKIIELWIIPVIFIIVTLVSMAIAYIMAHMFKLKRSQRNFAIASAMFMNSNTLPIALMQSLVVTVPGLQWGDDDNSSSMLARSLTYLVVYSTLGMIVRWSYGVKLLSAADDDNLRPTTTNEEKKPSTDAPESSARPLDEKCPVANLASAQDEYPSASTSTNVSGRCTPDPQSVHEPETAHLSPPGLSLPDDSTVPRDGGKMDSRVIITVHDVTTSGDNHAKGAIDVAPTKPRPSITHRLCSRLPSLDRLKRAWHSFCDFMTAPLWAALASFVVACIYPIQNFLNNTFPPVKQAIDAAGNCSIPITLVVLGAFFYTPPPPEPELPTHQGSTESRSRTRVWRSYMSVEGIRKLGEFLKNTILGLIKRRPSSSDSNQGETRAIFVSVTSRMIVAPLILMPLLALWVKREWQSVLTDPVFVLSNVLLITAAPALTLAQITQAASGDTFERLLSKTIFWSYVVVTPPSTIVCILLGLMMSKL